MLLNVKYVPRDGQQTHLPFFPWRPPARGQRTFQTPTLCCRRGCWPRSASAPMCHIASNCTTHNAHAYYSNRCAFLLDAGKKIYVYYQIFPGSRPWYISARMRQVGLRMVTVFSYLKKTWDTAHIHAMILLFLNKCCGSGSLLFFLLNILVLGVFCLIPEGGAVVYELLDDFLQHKQNNDSQPACFTFITAQQSQTV